MRFRALFSVLSVLPCAVALGQGYPAKPVRIVVPDAGGGPDALARIIAPQLQSQTGQPFVVENRPGANTILGTDYVAKSPADGYTLLFTTTAFAVNPSIYKKLPFDPIRDFTPITQVVGIEAMIITVPAALPVKTLKEFIAEASKPGAKLSFGSPGIGNMMHLSGELFQARAGTSMLHIPYKGTGPAIQALFANEVQMINGPAIVVLQGIQAGKLRALAYTHRVRADFLPDVPTTAEAGVQGAEMDGGWFAMFGPAKMPLDIANRVQSEVRQAVQDSTARERIAAMMMKPIVNPPADFAKVVESSIARYRDLARIAKIEPE